MSNPEKDTQDMTFNGPGGRLRYLRETKGKSLEDVEKDSKLSVKLLTMIENDDYRDLHSEMLAKSYLRAYAKWAGYSDIEILQEFEDKNLGATIISKKPQVVRDREATPPSHRMRWLTYLVIGGLVILTWTWWHNHSNNNDKSIGSNVLPQQETPAQTAVPVVTAPTSTNPAQPVVQQLPIQKISNQKPKQEPKSGVQESNPANNANPANPAPQEQPRPMVQESKPAMQGQGSVAPFNSGRVNSGREPPPYRNSQVE